jgi:hypothetical protein
VAQVALRLALCLAAASPGDAFRLIGENGSWARWDAAVRTVDGVERSLDGGLRYSIETGSYAGLRDQFSWVPSPPSEQDFAAAIERAFDHWEVIDARTGLPAAFYFVEDLATPAVDDPGNPRSPNGYVGLNAGAEIDIFAATPHAGSGFAASVIFFVDAAADDLQLTSGATNYPGLAITGADIRINPLYTWSLSGFEILLTHEIGHALGLADLEVNPDSGSVSGFIDDDFDPTTSQTAFATLTDHFAFLVNRDDPDASPLQSFNGSLNADPGLQTSGVEILMESEGIFDLLGASQKLQPDDVAGRQFLYPAEPVDVPEPGLSTGLALGAIALAMARRHARPQRAPNPPASQASRDSPSGDRG